MTGQIAIEEIERKRQKIDSLSQYIWNHPEAGFKEYKAQEKVADLLREEGFQVETGAGGSSHGHKGCLWKRPSCHGIFG